jgi:hypothetical protein
VQGGTPFYALQELGGWESPEMVRRYAHLSVEHLAPHADHLCALRVVGNEAGEVIEAANGTNLSQGQKAQRASSR